MISVEHLTKYYGDFLAVDDLSFEIDEGHVYGFLGPNGAGKTTTMNIMTGCLSATVGSVKVDGHDIFEEPDEAKKLIGYLPEQPPLYMGETPAEYLRFVGEAKGLRGAELKRQIQEVIARTKIGDVANRRISALSKGYKQRVGIAQALLGNPRAIILDEPTVGLDPIQIIEIRDLIRELGGRHTVILSSHILPEVQTICDRILIIAKGKLIAFDEPDHLEERLLTPNEIILTSDAEVEEVKRILSQVPQITEVDVKEENDFSVANIRTDGDDIYKVSREVFLAFAKTEKALLEMTLKKASLEDIFIELTEGGQKESAETSSEDEETGRASDGRREVEAGMDNEPEESGVSD